MLAFRGLESYAKLRLNPVVRGMSGARDLEGRSVGHYRIDSLLGAGGTGVVYAATDTRLQRAVAIKFLLDERAQRPTARIRFLREAQTASSLNHPNICTVFDVGELEGCPYLVMERLEGRTLAQSLAEGPLETDRAIDVLRQVANGLREAHGRGIVHRDIKPSNIFVTRTGQVKILDFGIAQLNTDSGTADDAAATQLTEVGGLIGTVAYMSPEQALGRTLDQRSDLFSLGVVFYEMLSGQRPFKEATPTSTIDSIIHAQPKPLPRRKGSGSRLERIANRLLTKEPDDRYPTAAALLDDLDRLEQGVPSFPWERSVWRRSPRWIVWALLLLFIPLIWGLSTVLLERARSSDEITRTETAVPRPVVAVLPLANLSQEADLEQVALGIAHSLITSLSGIPSVTMVSTADSLRPDLGRVGLDRIVRDLGASFVVTGSLQEAGNRLRVTLNLNRGRSVFWGASVEGDRDDLFSLQQDLAYQLSEALELVLTEDDRRRLSTPPTVSREAYAEFTQAHAFLDRPDVVENLDRAVRLFESAIQKDPDFALAYAGLGEAYWTKYKQTRVFFWTERAGQAIRTALRLDPFQAGVHYTMALIHQGTGETAKAIQSLREAQRLQPANDDVHRLLGEIYASEGRVDAAVQELEKAIRLRPNFWGNHSSLGLVLLEAGRYFEAVAALERVTKLQPDSAWGFLRLGVAYHSLGDLEKAKANYQEAIRVGPSWAAHSNLGTILYREKKYAEAAENYRKALDLQPRAPALHRNLADTYLRLGRQELARDSFIEALELSREQLKVNPRDARTLGMVALLEAKLGRHIEASHHMRQAHDLAPKDGQVLFRRAVVHALAGQEADALKFLKLATEHGYSASEAAADDDLNGLKSLQEFLRGFREQEG